MSVVSRKKIIYQRQSSVMQDILPRWIKVNKSYSDFSTSALTNSIDIYSLPAKSVIQNCIIKHSTEFNGGIIATYTISVGIIGSLSKYTLAFNVFQPVTNIAIGLGVNLAPVMENYGAVTSIKATAISTVGLLNAATQGSVDIYLLISTLP